VGIRQMLNTLVMAIEQPEYAGEIVDVVVIRKVAPGLLNIPLIVLTDLQTCS
jgi:hypothetical protein